MDRPRIRASRSDDASRLSGVDAARGIAALLVVLLHASDYMGVPKYFDYRPLGGLFQWGWAGVDFFFVLSGFVITYSSIPLLGRPGGIRHYFVRRFTRIYPIYWVVTAMMLAGFVLLPVSRSGFETGPWTLFTSITLLPSGAPVIVPVAWTLIYEVLFYALFAVAVVQPRSGFALLAVWQAATLVVQLSGASDGVVAGYLFGWRNLHFGLGVVAALIFGQARLPLPGAVTVLGTVVFGSVGMYTLAPGAESVDARLIQVGLACSSALIVLGLAESERSRGWRVPDALSLLGAASYSIYLIHSPADLVLIKVLLAASAGEWVPPFVLFLVLVAGAVACGVVLHLAVERPLLRITGDLLRRRGTARAAA